MSTKRFFTGSHDIPLDKESARRYLPMIIGLLVFLLIIIWGVASSIGGTLDQWKTLSANKLTLEISALDSPSAEQTSTPSATPSPEVSTTVQRVLKALLEIPGVVSFDVIDREQALALLKSWIGDTEDLADVPLPILIDVELDPKGSFNMMEATKYLREISPHIRIESHAKWHQMLLTIATSLRVLSLTLVLFIGITILVIIALTTRSSLTMHKSIIDTLRLMGARNMYISRYFQHSSFKVCFKGALVGFLLSIPTLFFASWLVTNLGIPDLFTLDSHMWTWVIIVATPFAVSFFAMLVAHISVMRTLSRLEICA